MVTMAAMYSGSTASVTSMPGPSGVCPATLVKRSPRKIQSAASLMPAMPSERLPMRRPNNPISCRIAPSTGSAVTPVQMPKAWAN
ncbi:hypothetical protein D3C83_125010 [compost metagenome]